MRLFPTLPQDIHVRMMTEAYCPSIARMLQAIRKEQSRKARSFEFRTKRFKEKLRIYEKLQALRLLAPPSIKNKNRQAAALKRVRDPNGKF